MTVLKCAFYVLYILSTSTLTACTSCGDGYFSDENGECSRCPVQCPFCDSNEKCLSCSNGYWGSVCELPCTKCKKGTSCEKINGFCLEACRDGLSGVLCDARCSENCSSCSRRNINNCVKCAPGRYPHESCNSICSKCNNTACNEDGSCTSGCVKGYWGNNCESVCSEHCLNNICEWKSGNCTHGCVGEYTGPRCVNGKEKSSTTIFVLVGTGIALISLVVVVVVCIRRERQKHKGSKSPAGRSIRDPEQRCQDAETTSFISGSDVGRGQVQLRIVQKGMLKLQELLERIKQKTEEDFQSEFKNLPNLLNKETSSAAQQMLTFKGRVVSMQRQSGKDNKIPLLNTEESSDARQEVVPFNENVVYAENVKTSASFIQDTTGTVNYIAATGPTDKHEAAFTLIWAMLWQQKCQTVVMLYNINEKNKSSEQYWPDNEEKYGDWYVRRTEYTKIDDKVYTTITFKVLKNTIIQKLRHNVMFVKLLHYYKWPEEGIVDNIKTLLEFRKEVNHARQNDSGPLVVLERNGAGRTGTYIALDLLLKMVDDMADGVDLEKKREIDVFDCVMNLRKQRMNMVETIEQYKFLYRALSCYISEILKDKNGQEKQSDKDRRQVNQETKL